MADEPTHPPSLSEPDDARDDAAREAELSACPDYAQFCDARVDEWLEEFFS